MSRTKRSIRHSNTLKNNIGKIRMKRRSILLFLVCIAVNLLVGNLALLMFPDVSIIYRISISVIITTVYGVVFYKLESNPITKWQLAGISILLSLFGMLVACIFTSVGMRLPMDNIMTAALKGIIPMFIFALFFGSPFWIPLAIVNFVCLNYMNKQNRILKPENNELAK